MPGLGPGIHVLNASAVEDVDGRDKPGHDEAAPSSVAQSNIATARVQPADPPVILCGKHATVNPLAGSCSRLHSFSMWQYGISRPALWPSQMIEGSRVSSQR